jgi:RimJ/RimL family protein N-acetyltransferase
LVDFIVRQIVEDDWESYRALRLEMLLDTPIAYTVSFETARDYSEAEWRERASRGTSGESILVAAIDGDGRWIGSMGGYVDPDAGGPTLFGVYVAPAHRGRDAAVTDGLLEAVEVWARARSSTFRLEVHEDNARARAAYAKRGFVETGHRRPYDLDASRDELEMIKRLR